MSPEGAPRAAVVGTGAISQVVHVPILAERSDVELALVSDADVAKARTVAERFGACLDVVAPNALEFLLVFDASDLLVAIDTAESAGILPTVHTIPLLDGLDNGLCPFGW